MNQVSLFVVVVLGLVGGGWCLPTGQSVEVLGSLLSNKFNYSCNECERMQRALLDVCKWNHHVSKPYQRDFKSHCADLASPVSSGQVSEKCESFYATVERLYCPVDPCVPLVDQLNLAPNAVCGMLMCTTDDEDPAVAPVPTEPWTCPAYVDLIRSVCAAQIKLVETGAADQPTVARLCESLHPHFEQQGCNLVGDEMAASVNPMALCSAMTCDDQMESDRFCSEVLNMSATSRVIVPEYETYLLRANNSAEGTEGLGEGNGINIIIASFGANCAQDYNPFNNIGDAVKEICQSKVTCVLPNPALNDKLTAVPLHNECDSRFTIHYTCSGGRKHRIYAPTNTTYDSLVIDCSKELIHAHPFGAIQMAGVTPTTPVSPDWKPRP